MSIITLTTDMGLSDYYVAALKGRIISMQPDVKIVDISHSIPSFRINQAAYTLKSCMSSFPDGTVHIIGVDAEPLINFQDDRKSIYPTIVLFNKHYFISADNGFFGLLMGDKMPDGIWRLEEVLSNPKLMNFPTKNIFVPAACKIIQGEPLDDFCTPVKHIRKAISLSPILEDDVLKGAVSYIDHYGNLITNITQNIFEQARKGNPFVIYFRRKEYYIDLISTGYNEVPAGEKLALFNDSGFLEIAINKGTPENGGGASSLLGIGVGDTVRIEFIAPGSRNSFDALF